MIEPALVAVIGPTGSGKSDLALHLAQTFQGEIVNFDSVQIYRYLDIGSAKTPPERRRDIPHHLLDIADPDEVFTAGDYSRLARSVLSEIAGRGRLPILVGGTGFYLRALLCGLAEGPTRDDDLRSRLLRRKPGSIERLLRRLDPQAASRIHPNDIQKLVRALEVRLLARTSMSELFLQTREPLTGFRVLRIGLDPPREILRNRINLRCTEMFESGLIEEVRKILKMGFAPTAKALEAIGYQQALQCLRHELPYKDAVENSQIRTRQYAKRQMTWFRTEPETLWLPEFGTNPAVKKAAEEHVRKLAALTRNLQ